MEIVFLQALQSESAASRDKPRKFGAFLWDLRNFYEHVDRKLLWQRAKDREYNMAIVAVALNHYGTRRFIGLEELALDCGHPERGIAAGCGWATTWVQVYTLDPLLIWQHSSPHLGLTVFIDDLFTGCEAEEDHQVVGRLTEGAAKLKQAIEEELRCEVAAHNASSSPATTSCLRSFVCHSAASVAWRLSLPPTWGWTFSRDAVGHGRRVHEHSKDDG